MYGFFSFNEEILNYRVVLVGQIFEKNKKAHVINRANFSLAIEKPFYELLFCDSSLFISLSTSLIFSIQKFIYQ